jgi:hypothetical protein
LTPAESPDAPAPRRIPHGAVERPARAPGELEAAILTRIYNDGNPIEAADPEYAEGLRAAVPIALEYCLTCIERGEASPPPIPTALLSQARIAARNGIALDTVLCRYFAGYTLLGDFAIEEVDVAGLRRGAELKRLLRTLATSTYSVNGKYETGLGFIYIKLNQYRSAGEIYLSAPTGYFEYGSEGTTLNVNAYATAKYVKAPVTITSDSHWFLTGTQAGKAFGLK